MKRLFSSVALVVALGCGPAPASESRPAAPSPSSELGRPRIVVLISLDTLRPDHLGIYGYDRPTSPVIDALGREGAVFEDASTTSPWTYPSHASMLTGLYPNRHAATYETSLHEKIPTLASILSRRGYATAAVVNALHLSKRFGLSNFESA